MGWPCNPYLAVVGIGLASGVAIIALSDGTTQRVLPWGASERPAVARVHRAHRPAAAARPVLVWGECWWLPGVPAWPGGYGVGTGYGGFGELGAFGGGGGHARDHGGRGGHPRAAAGPLAGAPADVPLAGAPGELAGTTPADVPEPAGIGLVALALAATLGLHTRNRRTPCSLRNLS